MSFLSKILARRKERRPPKRSAAHIPRGIATSIDDDVWNGPTLGPDVIPAIPRSPIDYAFNKDRQVWQPQARPVSPILPIQADAAAQRRREQQRLESEKQHRIRHQASTGDLERIVYFMSSPTASTFSSTSLPPMSPREGPALHHQNSRESLSPYRQQPQYVTRSSRNRMAGPFESSSSPVNTQDFVDVGALPMNGPSGSLRSPPLPSHRPRSAGSDTSDDEPISGNRRYAGASGGLPDQEEYVEPSRRQVERQRSLQHLAVQPLPDQVEYLSDSSESSYGDREDDQHEPQGLEQFGISRGRNDNSRPYQQSRQQQEPQRQQQQQQQQPQQQPIQSPSMSVSTATTGPFHVDMNNSNDDDEDDGSDTEDELDRLRSLRHGVALPTRHTGHDRNPTFTRARHDQTSKHDHYDDDALYEDDTISELSSYSAAAAAFPLAVSAIGVATTVNEKKIALPARSTAIETQFHSDGSESMHGRTALSPPPRLSSSQRLTDTALSQRASSNVVNFATMNLGSSHSGLYSPATTTESSVSVLDGGDDDPGRTSWVSSVSSYYGAQPGSAR